MAEHTHAWIPDQMQVGLSCPDCGLVYSDWAQDEIKRLQGERNVARDLWDDAIKDRDTARAERTKTMSDTIDLAALPPVLRSRLSDLYALRAELAQERNERDATATRLAQLQAENERLVAADTNLGIALEKAVAENELRSDMSSKTAALDQRLYDRGYQNGVIGGLAERQVEVERLQAVVDAVQQMIDLGEIDPHQPESYALVEALAALARTKK